MLTAQSGPWFTFELRGRVPSWGFDPRPGQSLLAGAAPYYGVYETADGGYLAIGALEPQFFGALLRVLDLDDTDPADVQRMLDIT